MKRDLCNDKTYILKYKINIKNDGSKEIVIYYADGTEVHRPYSKNEEIEILGIQREQIKSVVSEADKYRRKSNKSKLKTVILGAISIIYAGILFSTFNIPTLIAAGLFTYFTVKNAEKSLNISKQFRDIEKYKIFLKNENAMNDAIEGKKALTEDYEHTDDMDNKIRQINSNTIDNADYRSIKTVMRLTDVKRKDWGDDETLTNLASRYKDEIKSKVKVLKR